MSKQTVKNIKLVAFLALSVVFAIACSKAMKSGDDELVDVIQSHLTAGTKLNVNSSCVHTKLLDQAFYVWKENQPKGLDYKAVDRSKTIRIGGCYPESTGGNDPVTGKYKYHSNNASCPTGATDGCLEYSATVSYTEYSGSGAAPGEP